MRVKRTNLVLDERLLAEALQVLGAKTSSAAVNTALEEVIRLQKIQSIPHFFGSGIWQGGLSQMREDRPPGILRVARRSKSSGPKRAASPPDPSGASAIPPATPAILKSMSRMLEEIRQQPEALERTLSTELRSVEKLKRLVEKQRPRLVVLVARGTSDNAALFGRYLLEITTGIPVSLAAPSIATLYEAHIDYRDALVVGISQSGESTDTNLVLERARQQGALTLGITNESASAMARLAEHVLLVRAGHEKSVAATKTYTGQMLMMYLLAYALGGGVRIADLERIPDVVRTTLALEPEIDALSERYRFMRHAVVVGRGLNYSNAFEMALKLMETCYVVAERFSSADFLHGPIALVEQNFPVFAFAPPGKTWPSIGETLT